MRAASSCDVPLYLKVAIQVNLSIAPTWRRFPDAGIYKSFGNGRAADFIRFLAWPTAQVRKITFGCGEVRKLSSC